MNPFEQYLLNETRRSFFKRGSVGLGAAALASLLANDRKRANADEQKPTGGLPELPHHEPKAKRAIYMVMNGAPSQIDMYDYKPKLKDMFDKDLPAEIRMGQRLTTMTSGQARFPIAPSMYNFKQYGQGGMWISDLLPHTATVADDIAFIRSTHTEAINHDPAITYIQTGNQIPGRPSLGSWLSYGLGTENENLPSFVVMTPTWTGRKEEQAIYNRLWGSGFLPSKHQGVLLGTTGDPVLFLSNPNGVSPALRRRMLDALGKMNQQHLETVGDPETQARISQYEMAYRMQSSVPELTDLSSEPKSVLDMYGPDVHKPGTFAYCCLLARRMAERGVRFVQLFHRGWDQHGNLPVDLPNQCRDIDQATSALITDLKQRGLFKDTLLVWGGEFGRTVYCQGKLTPTDYGRDHHPRCFTTWMAGAGIKGGTVYGETDDFSYNIVKDPVHIHDLNATILHQLGIDHARYTVNFQGLDQRLTGVEEAHVVKGILS